jgi:hypothetical protein
MPLISPYKQPCKGQGNEGQGHEGLASSTLPLKASPHQAIKKKPDH